MVLQYAVILGCDLTARQVDHAPQDRLEYHPRVGSNLVGVKNSYILVSSPFQQDRSNYNPQVKNYVVGNKSAELC